MRGKMKIRILGLVSAFIFLFASAVFCTVVFCADDLAQKMYFDDRYTYTYAKDFFRTGGERVRFNQNLHLKIGILINNRSGMSMAEVIAEIFTVAPLDRYRDFFVFVNKDDVDRGRRNRSFFIRAYNGYGREIPGGFDIGESSIRAGLIVLNVENYEFTKTGTKGYAKNQTATAQKMTILHELGHAFAELGDEYSIKQNEYDLEKRAAYKTVGLSYDYLQSKVWNSEYPNLDYRSRAILKWQPLIEQGFIPQGRFPRIQLHDGGIDHGRFLTPTDTCLMNRILHDKMEFCPVCQLQIIDRISELSGVTPPWYADEK
jgi:hypothetical protein